MKILNVIGAIVCAIFIAFYIISSILAFDKLLSSLERLEKSEKERHDIIVKMIENMGNIHSQK